MKLEQLLTEILKVRQHCVDIDVVVRHSNRDENTISHEYTYTVVLRTSYNNKPELVIDLGALNYE